MCIEANCHLSSDVKERIKESYEREDWQGAKEILDRIIKNFEIADSKCQPVCQDTGVACVFLKIGQDVHIDGDLNEAVNEGVRQGYRDGFLRKSVVKDPAGFNDCPRCGCYRRMKFTRMDRRPRRYERS